MRRLAIGLFIAGLIWTGAGAAEFKSFKTADGTVMDYALVLPNDFRPARAYPVILALPPGQQTRNMVITGLDLYWEREGAKRGYIVVSPVAPGGKLFFRGSEKYIPEFLAHIAASFVVKGGKFHVTGMSNGGLSAFRVALRNPGKFASLTVVPGFPPSRAESLALFKLKEIKINMYVGGNDETWKKRMRETKASFDRLGKKIYFEIVPGAGHIIQSLARANAARIFDRIPR